MSNDHGAAYWCDQYYKIEQQLAESITAQNELHEQIAVLQVEKVEANKKQAEQQARIKSAISSSPVERIARPDGNGFMTVYSILECQLIGDGTKELDSFLAKAKEEGRAEAQDRIKVLEDANAGWNSRYKEWIANAAWHLGKEKLTVDEERIAYFAVRDCIGTLSTTSPAEALDKVVREAKEDMRERCAKVADEFAQIEFLSGNEFEEMAAAIRRIEP